MSKVIDVLSSAAYAKATEEQKTALNAAYTAIEEVLKDSGFSVLINKVDGEKPEYVTQSRIDEVTLQKGKLSDQVSKLNKKLEKLSLDSVDPELTKKYQDLIKANKKLAEDMEAKDIDHLIENAARGLNPYDVEDFIKFIDRDALSYDKETNELVGLPDELTRLKKEKSYMLKSANENNDDNDSHDQTFDQNNSHNESGKVGMNDMIRSAAGRGRSDV